MTPAEVTSQRILDHRLIIAPEPGMREALAALAASYPLAIATNRGHSMPGILEHFGLTGYFSTVVTSRDVNRPKPAPDMLFEAAKRLQLAPQELLFVGDSELDKAAAHSARMHFAAYRGNLQADLRLEHHAELVSLLIGA
jgi:HAD superfamily hydrolase (TIGR01509 family)